MTWGSPLFLLNMATFWQILSKENRNKLADFYEENFGRAFVPPGRHDKDIELEGKMESLEEIDKLIRQPGKMPKGAYFRG